MKVFQFIDRFFWLFLLAGFILGILYPANSDEYLGFLEPLLMIILFLVFLKTDLVHIIQEIKNYKLIIYLLISYMIVIPVVFYFLTDQIDHDFAIGILLLTAMPAAVASPAISDLVNGNTALSISITIVTSIAVPFTIPLIFGLLNLDHLSIDLFQVFLDLTIMVFVPMLLSQILRKRFADTIQRKKHLIIPINIFILSLMVYIVIGSQQESLVSLREDILMKIGILYGLFIVLHIVGYLLGSRHNRKNRISICIGLAYMNNGLAIVLAAKYFDPHIVLFMVLSEIPWNTMIVPFRKALPYI